MSHYFIEVEVDPEVVADRELTARLVDICPVDIYAAGEDGKLSIVEENLDECVLCRLCLDATPPGSVKVIKLYEDGAVLA